MPKRKGSFWSRKRAARLASSEAQAIDDTESAIFARVIRPHADARLMRTANSAQTAFLRKIPPRPSTPADDRTATAVRAEPVGFALYIISTQLMNG